MFFKTRLYKYPRLRISHWILRSIYDNFNKFYINLHIVFIGKNLHFNLPLNKTFNNKLLELDKYWNWFPYRKNLALISSNIFKTLNKKIFKEKGQMDIFLSDWITMWLYFHFYRINQSIGIASLKMDSIIPLLVINLTK